MFKHPFFVSTWNYSFWRKITVQFIKVTHEQRKFSIGNTKYSQNSLVINGHYSTSHFNRTDCVVGLRDTHWEKNTKHARSRKIGYIFVPIHISYCLLFHTNNTDCKRSIYPFTLHLISKIHGIMFALKYFAVSTEKRELCCAYRNFILIFSMTVKPDIGDPKWMQTYVNMAADANLCANKCGILRITRHTTQVMAGRTKWLYLI